jgi:flavodoxin
MFKDTKLIITTVILITLFICVGPVLAQTATNPDSAAPANLVTLTDDEKAEIATFFGKNLIIVYSVTGNTLNLAETIQGITKGDIYRIETEETYPQGEELIPYAKQERDELRKPTLKGNPPDFSSYDYIFLGTPVWFHNIATATQLFLENTDFNGKKVVPFITAGGGPGDSLETLTNSIKNAQLLEAKVLTRYSKLSQEEINSEVAKWLKAITLSDLIVK